MSQPINANASRVAQHRCAPSTKPAETNGLKAIQQNIVAAFAEQYPPKYERSYRILPETFSMGYPRNGQVNFKFTTQVTAGAFVGHRDLGTQEFTGIYDMAQKKTSFLEGPTAH